MNAQPSESTGQHPLVPPPGCPAHQPSWTEGVARLYGPEYEADAMGLFEKLRTEYGPVAPVLMDGDLPGWLIVGYNEIMQVARNPNRFSRDSRRWRDLQEGRVAPDSPLLPIIGWQPVCLFTDGDDHERLRLAVTESMARLDRRGMRRHITRFSDQLIDSFIEKGAVELVSEFAEHLPMLVMTQLMGMPDEYGPRLVKASSDLIKGSSETAAASNAYVVETLQQLVERKRTNPGADLTSWLLEHPSQLSADEVVQHLRIILVAAHESTTCVMANTLRMVLYDPRFQASLAGGQMTLPEAIEQVLWDEPPFPVIPGRIATTDTELAGQEIKTGDMVLLSLAAGNVDPVIRPDTTASMRGNRSHLSFSRGPHECPGQDIGRAIADTGLETLLTRVPDLHQSVPENQLTYAFSLITRRLNALPAGFAPQRLEHTNAKSTSSDQSALGRTPGVVSEVPSDASDEVLGAPQYYGPPRTSSRWSRFKRWLMGG